MTIQKLNLCAAALLAITVSANAATASTTVLNLNMGEGTAGAVPDQEIIGGQIWNNLVGGATDVTLQFADGTTATGITATQAGSGSNSGDASGAGFGGSSTLDSMTTSLVFSSGATSTTLVVAGLPDGTLWDVTVWAGLNEAPGRTQTIDVNTTQVSGVGFFDQWQNGPLTFQNQLATGGIITLTNFNGNVSVEMAQGVRLTLLTAPEPSTLFLAVLGVVGLAMRRRRRNR